MFATGWEGVPNQTNINAAPDNTRPALDANAIAYQQEAQTRLFSSRLQLVSYFTNIPGAHEPLHDR